MTGNLALVKYIVRRFLGRGVEFDDLYQWGCLGLIKAIDRFDPDYPVQFSTYAVPVIMGEIRRCLRDDGPVHVSRTIHEQATTRLSAAQLVTGFGVSRRTIEMQFREATGKSILQEIQDLRIERAKLMLTQTSAPMDEVASSSGYPSTQAFRKYFTKSTGLSPLAFRQRSNANSI